MHQLTEYIPPLQPLRHLFAQSVRCPSILLSTASLPRPLTTHQRIRRPSYILTQNQWPVMPHLPLLLLRGCSRTAIMLCTRVLRVHPTRSLQDQPHFQPVPQENEPSLLGAMCQWGMVQSQGKPPGGRTSCQSLHHLCLLPLQSLYLLPIPTPR